ncbi:hypothetical protein [Actinocatenispora rupis]|uniref:SWIM zinc finger n=1 Tax=Actinocatenispora rupis TaxID=519421 RepID=A0A8J3ND34_9ACTN|nr:hypothetical protein [Actinocatenispora rupis]GID14646.1 hypothetical protein Aru02nite_55350 [Actinocatenispora rupis]
MTLPTLPPVAPDVLAEAVEGLSPRLRKKLDTTIERYATAPVLADGDTVRIECGEDTVVTLTPGASGAVTTADQATCTCLLAPRCLHRTAVLGACPVADPDTTAPAAGDAPRPDTMAPAAGEAPRPDTTADHVEAGDAPTATVGPTAAQVAAAESLWSAAAAVLAAGVPSAGAVPQAELLRAAHTARLAGLHRAEAAALRVVRGLRAARGRDDTHRLADLVAALRELLFTATLLARSDPDPALIGTARRAYRQGSSLRVHGVCREPVLTATGYAGVVTHVVTDDGEWYSVADVKPGGPGRARGAATAPVAIGAPALTHAQLARGGLLITGATISPEGRLGAGRGVRATPLAASAWSAGPLAALFARPVADVVADRLGADTGGDPEQADRAAAELVGCEVEILGAGRDHLLARPADGSPGPLIRLVPANDNADLAHLTNFRQLAARPGLHLRVVGRLDPERAATIRPLAVAPVPGSDTTVRLPDEWQGHADLGYDQLQGAHLPPPTDSTPLPGYAEVDALADSPLWQVRHLVELAVTGGRRAVAESGRRGRETYGPLRRAGFAGAADLAAGLTAEADRRGRDVFGVLTDPGPDRYAAAWLAAAVHLTWTERALIRSAWQPE